MAAAQSLRLIYTCNPSTILLLAQKLSEYGEQIIDAWAKVLVQLINTPPDFAVEKEKPSFSLTPW